MALYQVCLYNASRVLYSLICDIIILWSLPGYDTTLTVRIYDHYDSLLVTAGVWEHGRDVTPMCVGTHNM